MDKPSCLPIFVDMDGTLVNTDIAQELLLQAFTRVRLLRRLCGLCCAGRSHIKRFLAQNTQFSAACLPYNTELIDYLKREKQKGRALILATASDAIIADQVAAHLGFFDEVIASRPGTNLKGARKLAAIEQHASAIHGFEYIGDAQADYPIWQAAAKSGFVNPPKPPVAIVNDAAKISLHIDNKPQALTVVLKAMRPHQWAKNALVFLPLFFAHRYVDADAIIATVITFVTFCLCASGIYIVNDLLDIEADRQHPSKYKRPFAAGHLLPVTGVLISVVLFAIALLLCFFTLNTKTLVVLIVYMVITNLYSFFLKHYSTIDVITLTILYTSRIVAGGTAIAVSLSPWLLNFSIFFFLSLAYMKRYIELSKYKRTGKAYARNYRVDEQDVVMATGIANGGIAVFTLTLYLNSDYVVQTYASPTVLWMICPVMLFWIYRAWMWAKREKIDDDPVVFALKDKISLATAIVVGVLVVSSKYMRIDTVWL
ncbi:MAG: UbiA family prenyltransferase [Cellvibrionaceae bacterium]|nr:UbiA family prenyltransferase [Cellvibrionaceae bacterium]